MDLVKAYSQIQRDTKEISELTDTVYHDYFSNYFQDVRLMSERFNSSLDTVPITDSELELILTKVPLTLFDVSEQLAKFKTMQEMLKLETKDKQSSKDNAESDDFKEYQVMSSIYANVAARVDHEISFSKELIMAAKKLWDARKVSASPIGEVDPDSKLPNYDVNKKTKTAVW